MNLTEIRGAKPHKFAIVYEGSWEGEDENHTEYSMLDVFEVSAADLKKFAAANDWPVGEFIDGADGSAEAATVLAKALEAGQLGKKTGKVKVFGSDVGVENVESADSSVNLLFPEL